MNKFLFKSSDADFQKLFQSLDTLQKNILYITYRTDSVAKKLDELLHNMKLQKTVDDYFDDKETSPQTDSDEQ